MNKITLLKFFILHLAFILPRFCYAQDNNKPSINHVAICVHNLQKSAAFYNDVVQLKKIPNPFKDTVHQWFSIGPGIQLHVIAGSCPVVKHDINDHLCFSIASLPDFMKHLDQLNIKYGNWAGDYKKTQLRPDGVTQIYFQDPDGYWIEINNAK
jgi:lactoylglutathione lyase